MDSDSIERCVPYRYNADLVEDIRPILNYINIALLVASIILNFLTYKWRWLADFIIYFESMTTQILLLIP